MLLNVMEKPHSEAVTLPSYLLDLLGQARRAVEVDPGLAKQCLEKMTAMLTGEAAPSNDSALVSVSAREPGGKLAKGGLASWQLARIRSHIDEKLDTTILIEDLSTIAKLSPGHFCRAFKVSTGETPHGYIVRQRIRRAQSLMLNTDDTLSQIACACGLTDQAHLTRLFRRMLDETPLVWRRNWRSA
ncbi:helix-turn-helix domain-containing protein [Novosphingobium terrae]|uniref:helix-turn-helix domain-containing protein n=1 Tax=Novosphingobium terrae TaxID=2726189 RepID=UPI00197EA114|nr:AraC family transcriptional regulator [Novosphingobium terrae]